MKHLNSLLLHRERFDFFQPLFALLFLHEGKWGFGRALNGYTLTASGQMQTKRAFRVRWVEGEAKRGEEVG